MRHDQDRLLDMLDAIRAIEDRVSNRAKFDEDDMLRVWCLHHIVVIGEAASGVSDALRGRHTSVPWRRIVAMRNAVVHGYFHVDWDEVWSVIETDLEQLHKNVESVIRAEGWEP